MTRTDVAFAVRRSEQTIILWERGKTRPSLQILEEIAAFLACRVEDLFEEDGNG